MYSARCTEDGVIYAAVDFARLPTEELARKRRFLQCSECGGPAFFRKASRGGRAACFGARPHAPNCELAAPEYDPNADGRGEDQDQLLNPGNRIVVDLNYGAAHQPVVREEEGLPRNRERRGRYGGERGRPQARMQRRLSTLLRNLIEIPEFRQSDQILEIEGYPEITVRDFFVPLLEVTTDHEGQFLGYWGMLSDARRAYDGTLWLNSGGRDAISFCLDEHLVTPLFERYGIEDEEGLAGAYILVLGTPSVSQRSKVYCDLAIHEHMTMRLAR